MDRLDKIISNNSGRTRTEVKTIIRSGRVKVNGSIQKDPGFKVTENDSITIDNENINTVRYRYFMLNKPSGYISSTEPEPGDPSPNVISLFAKEGIKGLFPVGRLDKDTTGLLLVTNDGAFAHKLTAPGKHVDKTYYVKVKGILNEDSVEAFKRGFEFKEFVSKPAGLEILETVKSGTDGEGFTEYSKALVTISEGKFHQVKRMFMKVGCEVTELKRISMGSLRLDESLSPGEYRELTEKEIEIN